MRLIALYAILTFFALAIQTIVPRWLPLNSLMPNLVIILAVDLGLRHRRALAPVIAFAMGYAMDAFAGAQLGINSFVVTAIYLLSYFVSSAMGSVPAQAGAMLVFLAVVAENLGSYLLSTQFTGTEALAALLAPAALQGAVTALFSPLVFGLLEWASAVTGLTPRRATNRSLRGA